MRVRRLCLGLLVTLLVCAGVSVQAASRFPQPEFDTGYQIPQPTTPQPEIYEYLDVSLLVLALAFASWLTLRKRSRSWVFVLMLACLAYFGFWRQGCVCPVGSLQNVVLSLSSSDYSVPWPIVVFFLLPLVFALLFGRVFCAAVCPLGAIQDVVAVKPVRLPRWLAHGLGLVPYLYLGTAVLLVATGGAFVVCRYDPFVSLFRLSGKLPMLLLGVGFLLVGVVVARPYCRFLCPYGVLLNWMSRFSWRHVTITPDECVQCRLCEGTCPFDAIRKPVTSAPSWYRESAVARVAVLLVVLPLLIVGGGFVASRLEGSAARVNKRVSLAERILREDAGIEEASEETDAFEASGESLASLHADAWRVREETRLGLWILGGFLGLVLGGKLVGLSVHRTRADYEPDRGECLSCARCFESCPRERLRAGKAASGQE